MALIVNANKLTARVLAYILRAAEQKLRTERQAHKTPQGKQTVKKLMNHGAATSAIPVESPALFDRVARKCNVDYAFYKTGEGKYLLFFKEGQKDAITACFSDYSRLVLKKAKPRRISVRAQLRQAQEQVRQQPQWEREKVVEHGER